MFRLCILLTENWSSFSFPVDWYQTIKYKNAGCAPKYSNFYENTQYCYLIFDPLPLNMLGLYLNTVKIGHTFGSLLSTRILNEKKELHNFMTNNVFYTKKRESNTGPLAPQSAWCVTCRPPRKLDMSIEVKLFNCFNVMVRNINERSQICGPHFFNKVFLCNILICMDKYIWQFLIFLGVGFTAEVWLKKK